MKLLSTLFVFVFTMVCGNIMSAQWVEKAQMPEEFRSHHSFGFAINGTGYIVAGSTAPNDDFSKSFYSYDPGTDSWTKKVDFPGPARGFAIGEVYNDKAYFGFGFGTSSPLNDLWEYDQVADEWTQLPSCPCAPRFHPALTIANNKLIVGMGGSNSGNRNDFWMYDIETQAWEQIADFPSVVRHHPYQFSIDDYHYAGLGHGASIYDEWYRYDATTDTWEQMADLPGEGRVAGTQFAVNGKGYVLSGDGMDHSSMEEGEFYEYDPALDTWTELTPHPGTSRWAPASFVIENEVFIVNGQTLVPDLGYQYVDEVYSFQLEEPVSNEDVDFSFEVYPNPATDFLQVDFTGATDDVKVEITDITGQKIHTQSTTESINVSAFPAGTYLIEISQNEKVVTKKFSKL